MNFLEFSENIRLFAELLRQSLREEPSIASTVQAEPREPVRAGQVWATRTGARKGLPCMVLLLREDDALWTGVLLTDQLWMATARDLVLPEDAGSLDLPLVCLGLPVKVAPSSLQELLGELLPAYQQAAAQLCAQPPRATNGAEATDDDPREALRELLMEATRYLGDEAAAWSTARAPAAGEPSLWSRLRQAMSRAFEEAGAALVFPQEGLAAVRSGEEAGEGRAEATLALGDLAVELDLRLIGEDMILQGTAQRGDAPVAGVRVGLTRTESGQEPLSVERETDEDGVIFATRLPTAAEASYELEVAHGEDRVKLRW